MTYTKLTPEQRAKVLIPGRENGMRLMGFKEGAYFRITKAFEDHFTLTVGDIEDQIIKLLKAKGEL